MKCHFSGYETLSLKNKELPLNKQEALFQQQRSTLSIRKMLPLNKRGTIF